MNADTNSIAARPGGVDWQRWAPWCLAGVLLIVRLPWLGSEGTYDGDERYYTDATLRMIANGDLLRPEYADGSARLNKPLLAYWLIASSFGVFGPSLFAARLPFLLVGTLVIGLSGKLARGLFPTEPRAAFLAAAIAASNATLAALSVRSTPDILVVLATTIAWIGLAELLVGERPARGAAAWVWIGIGLAAASKGSLAIVVLLFVLVATAVVRRERLRDLVHVPALIVTVLIATLALAPLWLGESRPGGPSFVADQVTTRIARSVPDALALAGTYLGSLSRHLMPWVLAPLVLLFVDRGTLRATWQRHRRALGLVLAFALTLLVVFAAANLHRGRYLSPTYPVLACAAAVFVLPVMQLRSVRVGVRVLLWIAVALSAAITLVVARADATAATGAAIACGVAVILAVQWRPDRAGAALALTMTSVLVLAVPAIRHAFRSDYYARAAAEDRLDATWGFDPSTPSIVRVMSGGRLDPTPWPASPPESDFAGASVVLVLGSASEDLARRGWALESCGFRVRRMRASDVRQLVIEPDPRAWFAREGEAVYIARR